MKTFSEIQLFRQRFAAARQVLLIMKKVADEDKARFLREYPNGYADLESLNKDVDYMFEVLEMHEIIEAQAKS
jgi:hypothetical protein